MLAQIQFGPLEDVATPKLPAGTKLGVIVSRLIIFIFPIAGLFLLLYLVYGGYKYLLSRGDPKALQDARGTITTALVGFFIVFLSFWIVQIIGTIFGLPDFRNIFGGVGTSGSGCFVAGTKVKMADGTHKEIQKIQPGDFVHSHRLDTGKLVADQVVNLIEHNDYPGGYLIFNNSVKVTGNHLVWILNKKSWERADSIQIGDSLFSPAREAVLIKTIDRTESKNNVYNLHLNGADHNYFAEGILVHNQKI